MKYAFTTLLTLLLAASHSVAQVGDNDCKFLGNIIANSTPSNFNDYWNQVTPENAGKWGSVEAVRDQMNWTALDNAYNTAKSNGSVFKQHTFVWGQQQPSWMTGLAAAEAAAEIEEWIAAYCERYPQTDFIDVVNEPLHAMPSYRTAIGGSGTTGWDWVIWAFEKAREYCPNAKLVLNDYNILSSDASTTAYLQIITILKERNLIDVIGEQGHFLETTPIPTITANLNRLAATGLPIHISEFDLNIADDAEQKSRYEELFPEFWNHYAVHGVTLWGYIQGQIWRENAYLQRSNSTLRPAFTWLNNFVASADPSCMIVGAGDDIKEWEVFPNPVQDECIRVKTDRPGYRATIYNNLGEVQLPESSLTKGDNVISFRYPAGLYIIVLREPQRGVRQTLKILKH